MQLFSSYVWKRSLGITSQESSTIPQWNPTKNRKMKVNYLTENTLLPQNKDQTTDVL
jgi:hypothetical protein